MIKGKTKSGFKFEFDERIKNDWRLMDAIARATSTEMMTQIAATSDLVDLLLGSDKEKLMEHIMQRNDGFIPSEELEKELFEIISYSKATKNSSSSPSS